TGSIAGCCGILAGASYPIDVKPKGDSTLILSPAALRRCATSLYLSVCPSYRRTSVTGSYEVSAMSPYQLLYVLCNELGILSHA
ncbi:hypothetical protein A2U01_0054488, partial [Trifolium medium]|nr:hypothetical protein [Trifolium medium]